MIRTTIFANLLISGALFGQNAPTAPTEEKTKPSAEVAAQSPAAPGKPAAAASRSPYQVERFSKRAQMRYGLIFGVEGLSVKLVESGEMVRFSYKVSDADKAKVLADKKAEPALIDLAAGVRLVVPSLEKVGQLRQSSTPEAGRAYWMAFSNKGGRVKKGDRVNVVIGQFRADDLVVE